MAIKVHDLYGKVVEVIKVDLTKLQGVLVYYNYDNGTLTLNDVTSYSKAKTSFKTMMLINREDYKELSIAGGEDGR